jgi:hypothetical protein
MAVADRATNNSEQLVTALAALKSMSRERHLLRRGSRESEAAQVEEQRLIRVVRDLVDGTPTADPAR